MKATVIATVRVHGFHAWPDAPAPVEYLALRHRHLFTVRAEFAVQHGNRDVEFHIAQAWIKKALVEKYKQTGDVFEFNSSSCEHIAEYLLHFLGVTSVEVWEDDENGARVEA